MPLPRTAHYLAVLTTTMVFAGIAAGAMHPGALMDWVQHPVAFEQIFTGGQFPWQQVRCGAGLEGGGWHGAASGQVPPRLPWRAAGLPNTCRPAARLLTLPVLTSLLSR